VLSSFAGPVDQVNGLHGVTSPIPMDSARSHALFCEVDGDFHRIIKICVHRDFLVVALGGGEKDVCAGPC